MKVREGTSGEGTSGEGTSGEGTSGEGTSGEEGTDSEGATDPEEADVRSSKSGSGYATMWLLMSLLFACVWRGTFGRH